MRSKLGANFEFSNRSIYNGFGNVRALIFLNFLLVVQGIIQPFI